MESNQVVGFLAYYPSLSGEIYNKLMVCVNIEPIIEIKVKGDYLGGYLHFIAIKPEYRGNGVSTSLMNALLNNAEANNVSFIRVITWSTNHRSINLYQKHGFKEIHRIPNERGHGVDSVYLEVKIPPSGKGRNSKIRMNNFKSIQERKLASIVKQAIANTDYYRKKFNGIALEPFTKIAFESLPFLSIKEFHEGNTNQTLYNNQNESDYVFITEGNSEVKETTFWNISYMDDQITILHEVFKELGLTEADRVLNLLLPGISGSYFIFNQALEIIGSTIIPLGEESELSVIDYFISELQVNVLIGQPEKILALIKHYDEMNRDLSLKSIFVINGGLSEKEYEFLSKYSSNIHYPVYFTIETGIIASQCSELPFGTFHLSDTVFIELFDPESRKLSSTNKGKLIVTSLFDRASPCIRFMKEDHIEILNQTCSCGKTAPIIKLKESFQKPN
jgi:phenylacetate-CoA ligase